MRISDWSSDVCSSDLLTLTRRLVGAAEAAPTDLGLLSLLLTLNLTFGAPPKRRSRRIRPAGRRTWKCGGFREGRMPSRQIPPAPRTRRNAPGATAGAAFFAPGFFLHATHVVLYPPNKP